MQHRTAIRWVNAPVLTEALIRMQQELNDYYGLQYEHALAGFSRRAIEEMRANRIIAADQEERVNAD